MILFLFIYQYFLYFMRGFPLKLLQCVLEVLLKCWMQWVSILSTLYLFTFEYKISNVNITCTNLLISMDHDWVFLDYPYVVWIVWTNLCSNIYIYYSHIDDVINKIYMIYTLFKDLHFYIVCFLTTLFVIRFFLTLLFPSAWSWPSLLYLCIGRFLWTNRVALVMNCWNWNINGFFSISKVIFLQHL